MVEPLSKIQIWLLAFRLKTLPAAAGPVIMGTAIAIDDRFFRLIPALATLLGALLLQIGANLANDVYDFKKGADTSERLGPTRVTQSGLLSSEEVTIGMWVIFGIATIIGTYLVYVGGWPIVLIGLFSIAAAIAYTGGPYPLGYNGLGDIFVFIFFGLVAVCGTYYVQASKITIMVVWSSIPVGLLATNILVVNNLRDIETDKKAGKKTLAVKFGEKAAVAQYSISLLISFIIPLFLWIQGFTPSWILLTWLSIPKGISLLSMIKKEKGKTLNRALAATGQLELFYALLFSIGLVI